MAPPQGTTGVFCPSTALGLFLIYDYRLGSQLSQRQWAYAFALVTTLFFTCESNVDPTP